MAELTLEQKKAVALANARKRQAEGGSRYGDLPSVTGVQIGDTASGIAGQINRPIAGLLGFPSDVANAFARDVLGAEGSPVPFGREDISRGMASLGIPVAPDGESPQNFGEYVGRGIGEGGAMLLPMGGAMSTLSRGTGKVADWATDYLASLTRRPKTALVAENVLSAGSGAGGYLGNLVAPDSDSAVVLGELSGGLGTGVVMALPRVAANIPVLRAATRLYAPFTKTGARIRAEDRVRGIAQQPDEARARIEAGSSSGLSPAEMSKDPGLLALERAVLDDNPQMAGESADRLRDVMAELRKQIAEIGTDVPKGASREFIEQRAEYLRELVGVRAQQAAARAEARLARLRPQQRRSQASVVVREEVENALKDVKAQENQLWGAVPRDVRAPAVNTEKTYQNIKNTTPRAQQDSIPEIARRMLDPDSNARLVGDDQTVHELWGLRSALLDEARTARANGDFNTARISDEIADSILEDLGAVPGATKGEAGAALRQALDFSNEVATRFRRGAVGRILGYEKVGGASVAPESTLDVVAGGRDAAAAVGARQLEDTGFDPIAGQFTGQNTAIQGGVRQYVLNEFERAAMSPEGLNVDAARRFLRDRPDLIDQVPGLRSELDGAINASRSAGRAAERADRVVSALEGNKSATGRFLNSPVEQEVDRILKSQNPAEATREILRKVRGDSTGRSSDGIKSGFVDHLIRGAEGGGFDETGKPFISGRAMRAALDDKRFADAAQEVFSPAEMSRLRKIAGELEALEVARGRLPNAGGVMNDAPSQILEIVARVVAAKHGAQLGGGTAGGSLQGAQILSGRAKRLVSRLTNDGATALITRAVQDPELMAALLSPVSTRRQQATASRRLNSWLAGPGAEILRMYGPNEDKQ